MFLTVFSSEMYFKIFAFCFFNLLIFVKVNSKNYNDIYECSNMHDYILRILGKYF